MFISRTAGHPLGMRFPRPHRYGPAARCYDVLSFERPVYRPGRATGIAQLGLRAGDRVLDVGCGTGLNFTLLREAVGPEGEVVGIDASEAMLARAHARIARNRWSNVAVRHGDAAQLPAGVRGEQFDAVLFTYSLSGITRWRSAWSQAFGLLKPGGRVAVVDLALPAGRWLGMRPLARLACLSGGVDPRREPWRLVAGETVDPSHQVLRGGHIHVAVGTRPPAAERVDARLRLAAERVVAEDIG